MRGILLSATIALCVAFLLPLTAVASGTAYLRGNEYKVDTLFHNVVGPGTTQTSLLFTREGSSDLRVFYCTMDMTNPLLNLAGVCATDHLAGQERISAMAERKSREGAQYFVGINGDFFEISGRTVRGNNMVGTPMGPTVVNGEVFRARSDASQSRSFTQDTDGGLYVNSIAYGGTVTNAQGESAPLGGVNIDGMKNYIIIYNYLHYGETNQTSAGWEVETMVADGETFKAAGVFHLVVTGDPSDAGDMTVPRHRYVLRGQGNTAAFVQNLHVGDTLTVNATWTTGGLSVDPKEVVSGSPKILENGVTLNSEGDRGGSDELHPRTGLGYSDNGDKVYFVIVDGRSSISAGCRTTVLADIMHYAGATDAVNLDGGGSSILYTQALGVRNVPSDGYERSDGNAFYAVHSAPTDSVVTSLRFADYKIETQLYVIYTPRVFAYNQYGVMIDNDVQGFTLSCPEWIGTIGDDGRTFVGNATGTAALTATLGDVSVTQPVTVLGDISDMKLTCDSVLNDTFREWPVLVQNMVSGKLMYLNPAALEWTSSDESVVSIGAHTGVLRGVNTGEATVTGTAGDFTGTMKVIVEKPTARVMSAIPSPDPSEWKLSMSGGKNGAVTALGDGFRVEFTGASTRSAYIKLTKSVRLWSMPDVLRIRFNPHNVEVTKVTLAMRTPGNAINPRAFILENLPLEQEKTLDLFTYKWMDTDDVTLYPITLEYVQFTIEKPTVGDAYSLDIIGLETIYNNVFDKGDVNGDGVVSGADVTSLYSFLLTGSAVAGNADINGDGIVNGADVTALYSMLLND